MLSQICSRMLGCIYRSHGVSHGITSEKASPRKPCIVQACSQYAAGASQRIVGDHLLWILDSWLTADDMHVTVREDGARSGRPLPLPLPLPQVHAENAWPHNALGCCRWALSAAAMLQWSVRPGPEAGSWRLLGYFRGTQAVPEILEGTTVRTGGLYAGSLRRTFARELDGSMRKRLRTRPVRPSSSLLPPTLALGSS